MPDKPPLHYLVTERLIPSGLAGATNQSKVIELSEGETPPDGATLTDEPTREPRLYRSE